MEGKGLKIQCCLFNLNKFSYETLWFNQVKLLQRTGGHCDGCYIVFYQLVKLENRKSACLP